MKKYKVITLCGSTKFKELFIAEAKRLTLEGNIVISVGLFGHSGDKEAFDFNTKEMLDDIHKEKIRMSDAIYVINPNGYIGESTMNEIKYAILLNKEIIYLETNAYEPIYVELPKSFIVRDLYMADVLFKHFYPHLNYDISDEQDCFIVTPELIENSQKMILDISKESEDIDNLIYGEILHNKENKEYQEVSEKYILKNIINF
jgi:hypothetical protein